MFASCEFSVRYSEVLLFFPTRRSSDLVPTVDLGQGDTILGDREDGDPNVKNRCTVGFIDEANAQMHTAGHCVVDGGSMYSMTGDRKSTRLNSSHVSISYAVFCLKKKR